MTKKPHMKELNLAFRGSLKSLNKKAITKLVQHHMAHITWDILDVHNYHKNGNGWSGIGYNFWIGFDGTIYVGRGFNQGAHCLGYNDTTIGIGYQGHFDKQQMTDAQLKAGIALNAWLIGQLPNVQASDIVGHGDLGNTACPGKNFRMSELKKGVSNGAVEAPNQQVGSETVTNGSIVDYLNSIGKNSSFSARKKYAAEYGIKGYKGTAKQNTTLLNKMRKGKPSKPSQAKGTVHLPASAKTWRTYKLNVKPVKKNSDWSLTPARYGGLTYKILDKPYPDVVTIKTGRGKRNIYVGSGTSAVIK